MTINAKGRSSRAHVPFFVPCTGPDELREVASSIRSGWLTTGPRVSIFESNIAQMVGAKHAVALNSCTAALHLALIVAGVSRGDEVVTTPYTFAATGEAILYQGARPVFVDIDPVTLNIDAQRIAKAITPRTRAILPVDIAGLPCDMQEISRVARRRRLPVIEDAAHSLGASIGRTPIGSIADLTCFSFYATKNLTTGEGGVVTTNDSRRADRIRRLSLHGLSRGAWTRYARRGSWSYDILEMGFKYNMTDVAAGLGLAQVRRFDVMQRRRRALARRYIKLLAEVDAFELPEEVDGKTHAWHLFILRLRPRILRVTRDQIITALGEKGIGTSVHFIPLHRQTLYRRIGGYRKGAFPIAERESARAISLPLYPGLTETQQDRVIEALMDVAKHRRR
jgi:dTDP-4-amino-4,6-dideoxygalactose transaminase